MEVKVNPRTFDIRLTEHEAGKVVRAIRNSRMLASNDPANGVADKLENALGYKPEENIY